MSVFENIKQAMSLLSQNEEYYNELFNLLSMTDKKVDYWLHYIELNSIPVTQGYKIVKELKKLREQRRVIKNELELMKVFKDNEQKLVNEKNRQVLLTNICRTNDKQLNAKYNYDAYTDDEIVEILGVKIKQDNENIEEG